MVDAVFESWLFLIGSWNDRKLEAYATWGKLPACQLLLLKFSTSVDSKKTNQDAEQALPVERIGPVHAP